MKIEDRVRHTLQDRADAVPADEGRAAAPDPEFARGAAYPRGSQGPRSGSRRLVTGLVAFAVFVPAVVLLRQAFLPSHQGIQPIDRGRAGIMDVSGPLGSTGKAYDLDAARAAIPPNRLILPESPLTRKGDIQGIWARAGQDAETLIQYKSGITLTEAVPSWDLPTALPRATSAPSDIASLGRSMLRDGSGMTGAIIQIEGQDAFEAYASDPTGTDGPGSIVVEVNGSEVSIIGTNRDLSMDDLITITTALIDAGRSQAGPPSWVIDEARSMAASTGDPAPTSAEWLLSDARTLGLAVGFSDGDPSVREYLVVLDGHFTVPSTLPLGATFLPSGSVLAFTLDPSTHSVIEVGVSDFEPLIPGMLSLPLSRADARSR